MKRRKFIGITAAGTLAMAGNIYMPYSNFDQKKLKIGLIGAGWYGMVDVKAALNSGRVEVIGICDVDSEHLNNSAAEIQKLQGIRPAVFKYYHDLLDMKGLEAVFIGTVPHWHALQFIAACEKKLDIYCEKPLSYDVVEGLAMVNAWRKAGNIVQVGFQRRQSQAFMKAKELIDNGTIGNVHQIVAQIHYNPGKQDTTIQPPPPSLDWEEWCGPAPKLEYRPSIGHISWRLENEYGNGHLVDWGIHHIDIIRKITGEGIPEECYSTGGIFVLKDQITSPDTLTAHLKFKKVPVIWQHRLWGKGDVEPAFNNGIFFHGEKGTLFAEDSKVIIFPIERNAQPEEVPLPTPMMQDNHVINFLDAVQKKDRSLIMCDPEDAFRSTTAVHLATIAYNTGSIVRWDDQKKTIIDNPPAAALLKREYRGKYVHP